MKKDFRRTVDIGNHRIEVTKARPEVYRITLMYSGGIAKEEFYRSFSSSDDAYRYCVEMADKKLATNVFCDFIYTVNFGGNEDEE